MARAELGGTRRCPAWTAPTATRVGVRPDGCPQAEAPHLHASPWRRRSAPRPRWARAGECERALRPGSVTPWVWCTPSPVGFQS